MEMYPSVRIKFTLNGEEKTGRVVGTHTCHRVRHSQWIVELEDVKEGEWFCITLNKKDVMGVLPPKNTNVLPRVLSSGCNGKKRVLVRNMLKLGWCTQDDVITTTGCSCGTFRAELTYLKQLGNHLKTRGHAPTEYYYEENNNPILGGELAEDQ